MLWELSNFELYRDNKSVGLHDDYKYKFTLPFEKIDNVVEKTKLLQSLWYHSITASICYYVIIRSLQWYMVNRPPFKLRIPIIVWDTFLGVGSIITFIRFSEDFVHSMMYKGLYKSLCYSVREGDVAAFWAVAYGVLKCLEFGDTIFVVLKKKPLIFLHYYHHAISVIYTIHSGAEHTGSGRSFIFMNVFAHSLMYPYYAFTASSYRVPKFVAMFVTTVQTVQMFIGVYISYYVYKVKTENNLPCQQSLANLLLGVIMYSTLGILFVHFFIQTYFVKPSKTKKVE